MLSNYIKIAVRNLLRYKVYSTINILGLAIGLASCLIIAMWVQFHLSFDSFHKNADQIYKVIDIQSFSGNSSQHVGLTPPPIGPSLLNDYPEIVSYCRIIENGSLTLLNRDQPLTIDSYCIADSTFFDIFSFEVLDGGPKTALREPNSLVLTDETAK